METTCFLFCSQLRGCLAFNCAVPAVWSSMKTCNRKGRNERGRASHQPHARNVWTGCISPITLFCSLHTSKGIFPLWLLTILQPQIGPFFALISGLTSTSPPFSLTLPWQTPSTSRTGTKYINQFLFVFQNINLITAQDKQDRVGRVITLALDKKLSNIVRITNKYTDTLL